MSDDLGFDLASDLLNFAPSPVPPALTTTRVLTTRALTTTRAVTTTREVGAELLRSLPLSVDETLARANASGRFPRRGAPEFYVWKIRLAVERGMVEPHSVQTTPLSGSDTATAKVWAGFVLLVGCKWLYDPGAPTVFSREFAAPWSDVTVKQARGAITALKQAGHMVKVGKHGRSTLWLPGAAAAAEGVPCDGCEWQRSCASEKSCWRIECAANGVSPYGTWPPSKRAACREARQAS
jgi:hypothetical protein